MPNSFSGDPVISVIVPVYNKENSLPRCFDSLRVQRGRAPFEIILVDDGSTDGSQKVCAAFAATNPNVKLISQSNGGVSRARNTGINAARGKFLLFLDADDAISPHTVTALAQCIERFGDEVDVISYPIVYIAANGRKSRHKREKWFVQDGVYSLEDYPYIAQTTMNVCVRNRATNKIFFSDDIHLGEDQKFVTENLCRTGKIGFCSQAEYYYTRDGAGASSRRNNPLFAYEDMLALFTFLCDVAENNSGLASYAYQTILYNIDWRIKSDMLFPFYAKGENYKKEEDRLGEIVRSIPVWEVANSPYLNDHHKGFLLRYFDMLERKPDIYFWNPDNPVFSRIDDDDVNPTGKTCILLDDVVPWLVSDPYLLLTKCMERSDGLHLEGRIISPVFPFISKPTVTCDFGNGSSRSVSLLKSSYSYSGAKIITTTCWTIRMVVPSNGDIKLSFRLETEVGSIPSISIRLKRGMGRFNARRERQRLFYPDRVFYIEGTSIVYRRKTLLDSAYATLFGFKRHPLMFARRTLLRGFKWMMRGIQIWVYSDLPSSQLEGNSFAQFVHDLSMEDGVSRYYVTEDPSALISRHPELSGAVLKKGSKAHFFRAATASVLLASYLERYTYLPYRKSVYSGFADLAGNQWTVYLQHGVLHAHLPWYYSYDRIAFDKEVVSTQFEIDNLTDNYCFPVEDLITSGMPRMDQLARGGEKPRKILYAPSWRNYLVDGNGRKRIAVDDRLLGSSFYKGLTALLGDSRLHELLERYDYTLDVKLHPNFACYNHLLSFDYDRVHTLETNINENDYAAVITDFSSYVFDFVYAGCKVMYFMPDRVEFDAGLNQYRELDLPLEDAFGPYTETVDEAVSALERLLAFMDGANDEELVAFQKKSKSFFLHTDGNNAQRLYEELSELVKRGC